MRVHGVGAAGRFIERNRWPLAAVATILSVVLLAFTVARPSIFGYVVALLGAAGGVLALYEIHNTRQIAQASFIRDLNTGFANDSAIKELWGRLLLGEAIEQQDRPLISSYFTFFETIFLLMQRRVLRLSLIDDLFRNRFFTAVGSAEIQQVALISHAEAFRNVHHLVASWSSFLREEGSPQHPGYYRFLLASTEAKGFRIGPIATQDFDSLCDLQDRVTTSMDDARLLRANDTEMLATCLRDQHCLGAFDREERLVGAAILYDAGLGDESVLRYVTDDAERLEESVNVKVVLVDSKARRGGLAKALIELLEPYAIAQGKRELACTVHRRNQPSQTLFRSLGFERLARVHTSYGRRDVLVRALPPSSSVEPLWG